MKYTIKIYNDGHIDAEETYDTERVPVGAAVEVLFDLGVSSNQEVVVCQ